MAGCESSEDVKLPNEGGESCVSVKDADVKTICYGKDRRKKVGVKSMDLNNLPPVPDGLCAHFIIHKNRYCRFRPHPGEKYCVEHSFIHGGDLKKKRIPCPINPSHSCYESQLEKHMKKCNFREDNLPVYHVKNINSGVEEDSFPDKVSCVSVPLEEVLQLIEKIKKIYEECEIEPKEEVFFHEALRQEVSQAYNGAAARKHLLQQASLVGHLDKAELLHNEAIYVEFGAGKGALSHWVQLALKDLTDVKYVLVEKSSVRYKKDSYHKEQGPRFERLRMDIEHLDLWRTPAVQECGYPVIGIGKHLCGAASDLALRCLMNHREGVDSDNVTAESGFRPVSGVMIAQCCHHRCEWQSYVGKQFFRSHGLGPRDFYIIRSMTSWATCAAERQDKHTDGDYNHFRYGSMSPGYRSSVGRQCKHLLDYGRATYLQSHGYTAAIKKYIDHSITVENILLIAHKGSTNTDS